MRTILVCTRCQHPVKLSVKAVRTWLNQAGFPFLCDSCQSSDIARAVVDHEAAKAEADTRVFQTVHLNPLAHENPKNRTDSARL